MTGARREARERALGLLYEAEMTSRRPAAVLAEQVMADAYAKELVAGVDERLDELDALIAAKAEHWAPERMATLDRAILRLATYELVGQPDVPAGVVLAEAVELASRYSTDGSGRFVNGILAAIANEVRG
ncbi:MAG TPA: transcription antitermination factor NusB [Acidimicrobiales bacterium]